MPSRKLILFSMGLPNDTLMTVPPKACTTGTTATIFDAETTEQFELSVVANNTEHKKPGKLKAPDMVMTEPLYAEKGLTKLMLKVGPTRSRGEISMLPNEPRLKIKDLKPMRMIGVTNTTREGSIIVQLGDKVAGGDSCTVHDVSNEPIRAGKKLVPSIEIRLPAYVSVPGNANVG